MAIQSINTLQNSDNYNNIAKEYLLESLANLGQRYNVKGDSISINSLYINRLFSFTNENLDDLCVVLSKEDDEYRIYLVDKNDISTNILPEQTISTKNNTVILDDFYLNTNKNTLYSAVKFDVDSLYYTIAGREDVNTALNKTNFFIERYDKNTNLLVNGIRVFKTHLSSNITFLQDKYLLVYISLTSDLNYNVSIYRSNDNIEDLDDSSLYEFITNINLDNPNISSLFTQIASSICEYDNYRIIANSSLLSWIGNSNDQEIFENQILYSFTNDIKNLYPTVKEKYSLKEYGSLDDIYVKLLINLYDSVKLHDADSNKLYIPLIDKDGNPYSISYTYNTNKDEELYFSGKEIEVRYIIDEIDSNWMTLNIDDYRGTIFTYSNNSERVSFFFFESKLDNENITDIKVKKISTLPYIDDNGYWVINDISTGIYAKGINAGNPNIIIAETGNKGETYNIIAGAKKDELLSLLTWEKKVAKVEPLEKINLDNLSFKSEYDYFNVNCCIPTLSKIPQINKKSWMSQLENAIIICISPISCIEFDTNNSTDTINYTEEDAYRIYGEYGIITTLWTIDSETNEFDYIRKSENKFAAADFNYLSNINNLIQYAVKNTEQLHPDNFEFSRIVFDPISATLKNNSVEYKTNVYGNILNKVSSEYNLSNYNNDLNLTIKYNDVILKSHNQRNIEALTQSGDLRYFNTTYNNGSSNSTNIVTNSLYNYYENGLYKRYNEYVPNYNVPTVDYSEVLTRNQTLLNRLNILSFDNTGTSYLSYIGTSIDNTKNILTIGTTETNINMGTDTLISQAGRSTFVKQNQLAIDFDSIKLNGYTYINTDLTVGNNITLDGIVWSKDYLNVKNTSETIDTTYYTSLYTPASRYIYELNDKYSNTYSIGVVNIFPEDVVSLFENEVITDDDNNYKYSNVLLKTLLSNSLYQYSIAKNKMFIITTLAEYYKHETWDENGNVTKSQSSHMIYYSDGIYLPVLLNHLGLDSFITTKSTNISTSNIVLTSNMEIISVNDNPVILLSSSTNLYPDKYLYDSKGEQISNFTYTIFTSNSLKTTYYTVGNKLYLHVEELYGKNKFVPNKEIRHNYNIS